MTSAAVLGKTLPYGTDSNLPLKGFPEGRARIRTRNDDFVRVFIRPPVGGVMEFVVEEKDGCWVPYIKLAENSISVQG